MKKNFSLLGLMAGVAMLLTSCNTDSYTHQISIVHPVGEDGFIYADQTLDSIQFLTFDSYHYYANPLNSDKFITVDEENSSKKIQNSPYACWQISLPVFFKPNTTSAPRLGYVTVDCKSEMDDWQATVHATYFQTNWHCIEKPAPRYNYSKDNAMMESCDHVMRDSAYQVVDTIKFYPFDKWTVESANPDMISPEVATGNKYIKGKPIEIPCKVAPNFTSDTLRTTLTITSDNGAKTTIQFQQAPKKKK